MAAMITDKIFISAIARLSTDRFLLLSLRNLRITVRFSPLDMTPRMDKDGDMAIL